MTARRAAARSGGAGFSTTVPAEPSTTAMSPGWIACASPAAPSTAGTPERAQHDRGMAVGAALLGRHAGEPGRIEQRGVGRAQRLADQHRALRQAGEAAERRAGQIAHQPPGDLPHLLGAARQAGAVLGRHAGSACARIAAAIASASSTTALSAESSVSSIRRRTPRIRRDGPSIRI